MLQSWDWKEVAACKHQQQIFFPQRQTNETLAKAREICAECPVQKECKEFAETNDEEYGIWSGNDRSSLERQRVKKTKDRLYRKKAS